MGAPDSKFAELPIRKTAGAIPVASTVRVASTMSLRSKDVSGYQTCNQVKRLGTIGPERDQDASRIFKYISEDGLFRYVKSLASKYIYENKRSVALFDDTVQEGCLFVLQQAKNYDHERSKGNVRVFIKAMAGFGFRHGSSKRFTGILSSTERQRRELSKARKNKKPLADDPSLWERCLDEEVVLNLRSEENVEEAVCEKDLIDRLLAWLDKHCDDFERACVYARFAGEDCHACSRVAEKFDTYLMRVKRCADKKMCQLKKEFACA